MLLADLNQIFFSHQRLPTGVDIHIYTELFPLPDDIVNFVNCQVQAVAVFRGPASCAVQVACACRIQEDRPGYIAAQLIAEFLLYRPADQIRIDKEICDEGRQDILINVLK